MDDHVRQQNPNASAEAGATRRVNRRAALKRLGAFGLAASSFGALSSLSLLPDRVVQAAPTGYPDIQFNIGQYIPPARTIDGIAMAMPPVYTLFVTAKLTRHGAPAKHDQQRLADALEIIEDAYLFSPSGVFVHVAYGKPYFDRLPAALVAAHMPLFKGTSEAVLQEAVPGPTDVSSVNPGVTKRTFNVPLRIEANDLLITLRGDSLDILTDVADWLKGSNRLHDRHVVSSDLSERFAFTSTRVMFVQIGLPRKMADHHDLPYAHRVNDKSPMWMGFFSQQANGFGPAEIATFQGNASARFTGMGAALRPVAPGDYLFNGSIQVLSHNILDLPEWYADGQTYAERAQLMFRSNPAPSTGDADQYKNGGGPAALPNLVVPSDASGNSDALNDAQQNHRLGHLQALQRATRAPDGTIIPQRVDGPGFDAMDVPDGSKQPKLQFSVFLPSAQNFAKARVNAAGTDLSPSQVPPGHNGIERFMTATRRQNFLCPPRAHRAFPLLELT
ncbi:MAG: hypothetical protein M3Z19_09540 [Chloroflexota bacterium]|nr:hypothetical protein [Chloroflexota bacterium]